MTNIKDLTNKELFQRMKEYMDELVAREIEEVKPLKSVKRVAEVGEKIVLTKTVIDSGLYKNGDVFVVEESSVDSVLANGLVFIHSEYEVLEEIVPIQTKSANEQRAELIERAREFVELHSSRVIFNKTEFVVNAEKRTVVALIKDLFSNYVIDRGIAKCMPDDVFNADIGKAIALARALEIDVPEEFLDAVQPDVAVIGAVVKSRHWRSGVRVNVARAGALAAELGFKITNDTNAIYNEVTNQ